MRHTHTHTRIHTRARARGGLWGAQHLPAGAGSRLSHREVEVQGWNPALWCPSLSPPPSPVATISALALGCDQPLPTALSPHQARGCPLSPVCLLNSDPVEQLSPSTTTRVRVPKRKIPHEAAKISRAATKTTYLFK